jgi:hypothetical protein
MYYLWCKKGLYQHGRAASRYVYGIAGDGDRNAPPDSGEFKSVLATFDPDRSGRGPALRRRFAAWLAQPAAAPNETAGEFERAQSLAAAHIMAVIERMFTSQANEHLSRHTRPLYRKS